MSEEFWLSPKAEKEKKEQSKKEKTLICIQSPGKEHEGFQGWKSFIFPTNLEEREKKERLLTERMNRGETKDFCITIL